MTPMTCDALALSYSSAGYVSDPLGLAHLASDPFDLAHLASSTTFARASFEGEGDAADDQDEDEPTA